MSIDKLNRELVARWVTSQLIKNKFHLIGHGQRLEKLEMLYLEEHLRLVNQATGAMISTGFPLLIWQDMAQSILKEELKVLLNDEPASELLKRIQTEKVDREITTKTKRKSTK